MCFFGLKIVVWGSLKRKKKVRLATGAQGHNLQGIVDQFKSVRVVDF